MTAPSTAPSPSPDPAPSPAPPPQRGKLRRSRDGRVGAGVAAGLGEYFGFDPVLFRVLFAASAFFGGAGVIAYLAAWAVMPDESTERASIDDWAAALRRKKVPVWLVITLAGIVLWAVAFSWWAPGPIIPVVAVVAVLVFAYGRHDRHAVLGPDTTRPVDLTKRTEPTQARADWVEEMRAWRAEASAAGRARRRRSQPVRLAIVGLLAAALLVLGVIDALRGIALPLYFWVALGIVGGGLLAGVALRRAPWGVLPLLVPIAVGLIAFAGTHVGLHDGVGQRTWQPTANASYRLAFGDVDLDLRALTGATSARHVDVEMAAGQLHVLAPSSMKLTVVSDVRFGQVTTAGGEIGPDRGDGGIGLHRVIDPPSSASGAPVTVRVHLGEGQVVLDRHALG